MSRMSKFAMPSSTPLYHDAIKTVASSDDDSPPARSPNLPSGNNNGKTSEICCLICSLNSANSWARSKYVFVFNVLQNCLH